MKLGDNFILVVGLSLMIGKNCFVVDPLKPMSLPKHPIFSAYVPPSMWETTFHTHTKQEAKYFNLYPFPRTVALRYTVLPSTVHPKSTSRRLQKFQLAGNVMWLPAEIKEMEWTIRPSCSAQFRFKRFHRMLIVSVKQLSHTPRKACAAKWLQHVPQLYTGTPVQQNGYNITLDFVQESPWGKMVATCPPTLYRTVCAVKWLQHVPQICTRLSVQ